MKKSAPVVSRPSNAHPPILIVDPLDLIGGGLYEQLKKETLIVLSSSRQPVSDEKLVFIPFKTRIPKIPDAFYEVIFFVWNGQKDMLDVLPEFLKKARADKIPFVFILPYAQFTEILARKILDGYRNSYVFVLGDLFGRNGTKIRQSYVDQFLYQSKTTGGVQIEGIGLQRLYPMAFHDSSTLLLQAVAEKEHAGKVVCLFPQAPLTVLSILRIIQKIDPLTHVDFLPEKKKKLPETEFVPGNALWIVSEGYPLQERLTEAYAAITVKREETISLSQDHKNWIITSSVLREKEIPTPNPFLTGTGLFFLYATLIFIFTPLFTTVFFAYFGLHTLQSTKTALERGDLTSASANVSLSQQFFSGAGYMMTFLLPEAIVTGRKAQALQLAENIDTGKTLAETAGFTLESVVAYKKVFSGGSPFPTRDFLTATNALKDAIIDYQMLGVSESIPPVYKEKLAAFYAPVELASNISNVLPEIAGADSERTYAILFQNNMELRPMGGFIGSYGVVKLHKGQLTDFGIHDVYDADGQLKGHVEPPFAIRRYLPLVHLYLRDSNFDIDFSQGAPLVAKLLDAETGMKVNGIIGVDLSFVKNILAAIGPVEVPEYHETVTAGNFFLLTESHAEKNFFPGSSQKKDFLRSLFLALQQKIATNKQISYSSMLNQTVAAIKEKHMLFAFSDPSIQSLFTVNNLSSSIGEFEKTSADELHDFIGINEANLGVNKVNYFLQRSVNAHANIDEAGIYTGEVMVMYKNASQKNNWPGGDYKNYLRAILPAGALLTHIYFDDHDQKIVPAVTDPLQYEQKGFIPPVGLEVEHYDENGRTVYGFLINIPAGESRSVKINYLLPQKVDLSKPIQKYMVEIFKQPGTDNDPFAFSLTYPNSLRVINASAGLNNSTNAVSYVDYLKTDQHFEVDFAKK